MLEYGILGPLQIQRDGVEVVLTAPKVRAMLLILLLHRDEMVSADLLVDSLWGDRAPESARKLVQVYVSALRAAIGADTIETVKQGYRIRVPPMGLDATRFDRMRRDGHQALADGNPELALALSRRALALWRGPALAEVADESYGSAEAGRLDELRVECTEDELDAELALGRHEEAMPRLRQLSNEHPLRERVRERLALALYRCGRQSEALKVLAEGRRLLLDELGLEPGKSHQRLEQAILNQAPDLDDNLGGGAPGPALVPAPSSTLIGRHEELEHLRAMVLRDDVRIVTVSGAGGSGKTRVALELARTTGSAFANGAAFVELASIQDPHLVLASIAQTLGVPEIPDETRATSLARWLQTRDLLLVIDNFEHVIEAAPELVRLVEHSPRLTIVVTSRRVLHLSGEHVFPLTPLPVDDAIALFAERRSAQVRTAATEGHADDPAIIEAICRRLDCLPLAVELAAARSMTLTPRQLLERLSDRVGGLGAGPRDAPARQKTLTDTLRWSTDLLSEAERTTLARLSVFAGGASIEAAENVCETDIWRLGALIDCSLLQRTAAAGEIRLSMLETIREHAARLLQIGTAPADIDTVPADIVAARAPTEDPAAGPNQPARPPESAESEVARARHAAWYRGFIEAAPQFGGNDHAAWMRRLDTELDNIRAAMDWALSGDRSNEVREVALAIATPMWWYWWASGQMREGKEWLLRALEATESSSNPLRAAALRAAAALARNSGELAQARALGERALVAHQALGDPKGLAMAWNNLCMTATGQRDFESALQYAHHSREQAELIGDPRGLAIAANNAGTVLRCMGRLDEAAAGFGEALDRFRSAGDVRGEAAALGNLGVVARRRGDLESAHLMALESLRRYRELELEEGQLDAIEALACLYVGQPSPRAGLRLLLLAERERRTLGAPIFVADESDDRDVAMESARSILDSTTLFEVTAEVDALDLKAVVDSLLATS